MNFIAKNVSATAKSWSVPATGKEPSVRIAAQPDLPRGFPFLPPLVVMAIPRRHLAAGMAVGIAAAADAVAIDFR